MTPAGSGMWFSKEVIIVHMPTYITSHYRSLILTDSYDQHDHLVITTVDNWLRLVSNLKSRLTETELAEIFDDDMRATAVHISTDPNFVHPESR